jgi:ABC-2 type transport system permease protein
VIVVARAVAWRGLHNYFTNPALVLPSLIFPLIFFAGFAGGLSAIGNVPGFHFRPGYTAFQFCFVLLQASAFGGVFTGFSVAADFEYGFATRFMLAAGDRRGILLGYVAVGAVRMVVTVAIITVVALVAGMQITGGGLDVVGMYALAFLVHVASFLWAAGIAMRFRTIQAGPIMQTPIFLILFLAPVFVPLELLEGWVDAAAHYNPVTLVLQAVRGLIAGTPLHTGPAFAVAAGLVVLFAAWALRGLRSAERAA